MRANCAASTGPRPRGRGMLLNMPIVQPANCIASTGPRPRGRGMRRAERLSVQDCCEGFNGAAPARARNACRSHFGATSNQLASTGPRPRGRGMRANPSLELRLPIMLQRGRARAGAECRHASIGEFDQPFASTGPRPRGRGMSSLVTLSSASSQRLICDCLRPFRFHSFPAVDLSHTIRSISSVYVMRAPAGFSASPRRSQVRLSKNTKSHTT